MEGAVLLEGGRGPSPAPRNNAQTFAPAAVRLPASPRLRVERLAVSFSAVLIEPR